MYNVYISTIYIYNRSSEPWQSIMTSILDFLRRLAPARRLRSSALLVPVGVPTIKVTSTCRQVRAKL